MLHSLNVYHNQQSTMSVATEDPFNNFIKTISTFQSMKGDLDEGFYNGLKEIVNKAMKQVSDHTGKYMHNLHDHQPDEDTLQKMIDNVPLSLSNEDENGTLPIELALLYKESVHYIPLLAKEGVKHKVGGENSRGGLLAHSNMLRQLVAIGGDDGDDTSYLNVMKELRESNLLRQKDIKYYGLLYWACNHRNPMRFDFLADLCPEGLQTHTYSGLPLSHQFVKNGCFARFALFFKASLKHYPNELGLLFQKDSEGQTACERAFEAGDSRKENTLKAIGDCIPFDNPKLPILHHVAKHAPQYMKDFARRYPSATYFRDCKGRTLQQATLASGHKTYRYDPLFFLQMSDEQVREIDPGSDLYPFMVVASGQTCDLSAVYALLRRNPSLAHRNKPKRRGKRKRK